MPSEPTATYAETEQFRGALIRQSDLSGLEIRDCWFEERVKVVDCYGSDIYLGGEFGKVVVNDVDVTAYVEAELDRIEPNRVLAREARTADDFRAAWAAIESTWAATVEQARGMGEELLHERVDDEWSFLETLRHLLHASDKWLGGPVLEEDDPFHPFGNVPGGWDETTSGGTVDIDPSLEEVLEPRLVRMGTMRDYVATLTDADLDRRCAKPGGDQGADVDVRHCLQVVLFEEAEHHRYAVRDLAVLTAG
ncbi:DinB family protein [Nocardioides albertanoniae]|uniref:DinB family protein n=1 Tax=Nocardioides albertanoniae TaxID=1175486 RepID=A0A543A319_9ACTN|nr:DinB family protein [Nocardioides albertanoniae]TQL66983.1 DinB family protein [Nocardioides albertanoniae]